MFTSSASGLKPSPTSLTYSLAKASLIMLTKCLAISLAKQNIRVNCICPGPIKTPLMQDIIMRDRDIIAPEALEKLYSERVPIGRYLEEAEVAHTGPFLVSDKASGITGIALPVDGGYTTV